jgi:hypothetical protein
MKEKEYKFKCSEDFFLSEHRARTRRKGAPHGHGPRRTVFRFTLSSPGPGARANFNMPSVLVAWMPALMPRACFACVGGHNGKEELLPGAFAAPRRRFSPAASLARLSLHNKRTRCLYVDNLLYYTILIRYAVSRAGGLWTRNRMAETRSVPRGAARFRVMTIFKGDGYGRAKQFPRRSKQSLGARSCRCHASTAGGACVRDDKRKRQPHVRKCRSGRPLSSLRMDTQKGTLLLGPERRKNPRALMPASQCCFLLLLPFVGFIAGRCC